MYHGDNLKFNSILEGEIMDKLLVYSAIAKFGRPRSYAGKIFLIAFIGTHIPLLSLFIFLVFFTNYEYQYSVLAIALAATLGGTALTLYLLNKLLNPVRLTASAMCAYRNNREIPDLPRGFDDEAGRLMADTQNGIEELDRLLRMRDRLISMVSHDSNAPIGSIKMACEILEDELRRQGRDNAETEELLGIIKSCTNNLSDFMNSMLSLSRFGEDRVDLDKNRVSVAEFSNTLHQMHQMYLVSKDISFTINIDEDVPGFINVDETKFQSVFNNLIQNAIKYTPSGGQINFLVNREKDNIVFKVTDNGIGIPAAKREHLFDPFSDSSEGTRQEKGHGLGLWIARIFTEAHGGTISVKSEETTGTEMKVVIPASVSA